MAVDPQLIKTILQPRIFALILTALFPVTTTVVFLTGIYVCGRLAVNFIRLILQLTLWSGTPLSKYGAEKGSWAVVTGASRGIGRQFALQLAEKGFNVALVSRSSAKIEAVTREIASLPGVKVKTIQHSIDFGNAGDKEWKALTDSLDHLDIGVLINNAGTNHKNPAPFVDDGPAITTEIVNVNAVAAVRLTSSVLPGMVARKKGLVLCTGSFGGGLVSLPLYATYSATKAFLVSWAEAVGDELRRSNAGVDIAVINTGYVATQLPGSDVRESITVPSDKRYVRSVLSGIGLPRGAVGRSFIWTPYWSHAFTEFFIRSLGLYGFARNTAYKNGLKEAAQAKKGL